MHGTQVLLLPLTLGPAHHSFRGARMETNDNAQNLFMADNAKLVSRQGFDPSSALQPAELIKPVVTNSGRAQMQTHAYADRC